MTRHKNSICQFVSHLLQHHHHHHRHHLHCVQSKKQFSLTEIVDLVYQSCETLPKRRWKLQFWKSFGEGVTTSTHQLQFFSSKSHWNVLQRQYGWSERSVDHLKNRIAVKVVLVIVHVLIAGWPEPQTSSRRPFVDRKMAYSVIAKSIAILLSVAYSHCIPPNQLQVIVMNCT